MAQAELFHGTLDTLVLKTLAWGPRHGYAIARWLEDTTESALSIEDGSLYPALYRLEAKGFIDSEWGVSELGRKAKVYRLTPKGRAHLKAAVAEWKAFTGTVSRVLDAR